MFHSVQQSRTSHGVYKIGQIANPTLSDYKRKDRMPFSSTAGIFTVSGSIHVETLEMEVTLEVYEMNLGILHGYAGQPFKIALDLSMVKGDIELRLTGFDELWLDIDTKVFQAAEDGSGQFVEYRKAHLILEMPGIKCAPWLSPGSDL
ncbi:hypothetical protein N7448_006138 [Penicillium atrosanguineum]|uniref:Uncharacterized protein n=1 Tax=Penicillium atrosanguineum TaxID=1132637 RepID=A0A9W9GXS0_9EURO|nr:uncharacterized protein N7443_009899 [Penicillium atrosanguineum]KAJ5131980.1 hypothetical protein N7448_006138 [Penicillium atrosanguineum]KAJ5289646.1 hypothetical protein N7443_009899 [Penicillium atrosanguineum]KAJ5307464.1 hypothetical protein N7476_008120 [Penicillium atrosanguineum]